MRIRLATYNIHRAIGRDGRFDPHRIARVLCEVAADVTALQEVETNGHQGLDVLAYLADRTGLHPIAGPVLLRETGEYGNALLTRASVRTVRRLDLSVPGREPRGALDVEVNWQGAPLHVVATHLGLNPGERRTQIQQLLDLFQERTAPRSILMGDLNEWFLWGRPLRRLQHAFSKTPAPPTFPARFPLFALDRIWLRPEAQLVNLSVHKSLLAREASDHLPLTAEVEW